MKETKFFRHAKVLWSAPPIFCYKSTPVPILATTRFCAKYTHVAFEERDEEVLFGMSVVLISELNMG